jgi:hypothetical protein
MKRSNVGFSVGLSVGKLGQPDKHQLCAINDLRRFCRKCRVFKTGESPGEFVQFSWRKFPANVPVPFGLE